GEVRALRWGDDHRLAAGTHNGGVIWGGSEGKVSRRFPGNTRTGRDTLGTMQFNPNATLLAIASDEAPSSIELVDTATGATRGRLATGLASLSLDSWVDAGRAIAVRGADK